MASQIRREKILCNFRPSLKDRSKKRVSAQQRREGNSDEYRVLIKQLPCCVTGRREMVDGHHIKSGPAKKERGAGMRATDRWLVPLNRFDHDELENHKMGSSKIEEVWFRERGIADVVALAAALYAAWKSSPVDALERMEAVLRSHMGSHIGRSVR